jgi:integrase/recombinase XerD
MFRYTHSGITVTVLLDTRRTTRAGLYPVKVRVTFQRCRLYYPTGKYLPISDWVKLKDTRSRSLLEIQHEIQISFDKVKDAVKELIKEDSFTLDNLNKRLGRATGDTVNTAFQAKIDALNVLGKVSTSDWYKYALRSIQLFGGLNIRYNQVSVDWLHGYEKYLLQEQKSYTTISMYMRALQVIMNEAKAAGVIRPSQHPFGKGRYEIPQPETRRLALTLEEIHKIMHFDCPSDTTEMCRDLWVFSYLCNGANITDICKLKFSNIRNNEICFYRQKTIAKAKKKKLVQAILTEDMHAIIHRWGNKTWEPNSYIFPFLQGGETPIAERRIIKNITKLMNDKLKLIGQQVGIAHISTYTARHSYATVLKRSGASISSIAEGLGHTDVRVTENYLDTLLKEERVKNAALLTNFKSKRQKKHVV